MNQTQQKPDTGDKGTQPGKAPEEAAAVQDQLKDVVENGAVTHQQWPPCHPLPDHHRAD